jgi:predicted aconitase with swiveling domain
VVRATGPACDRSSNASRRRSPAVWKGDILDAAFTCESAVGAACVGELLVSRQGFNARYDLDLGTGRFSRPEHDLYGRSLQGRVFVFTVPKGGIATSWALNALAVRGLAPCAILCDEVNPVVVQGAVLAGVTLMSGLPEALRRHLADGVRVRLDPAARRITLIDAG